jgi:hypothetical protein
MLAGPVHFTPDVFERPLKDKPGNQINTTIAQQYNNDNVAAKYAMCQITLVLNSTQQVDSPSPKEVP